MQLLANKCMILLNWDNYKPGLDWTQVHPALGVPLLRIMVKKGYADALGQPVYVQQAKLPSELTLMEFLQMEILMPYSIGRYVERAGAGHALGSAAQQYSHQYSHQAER
jgi:hypothetical protein